MFKRKITDLNETDFSVYNETEIEYLDKYLIISKNALDVKINLLINRKMNYIMLSWIAILTTKK